MEVNQGVADTSDLGTVTDVSVVTANGFQGSVANATTTPAITLSTSLTAGSVPFIGASGALTQDNANFSFNDSLNTLSVGGLVFNPGNGAETIAQALSITIRTNNALNLRTGSSDTVRFGNLTNTIAFSFLTSVNAEGSRLRLDGAAHQMAIENGTDAQTFRVYRTLTNLSNYERLAFQSGAGYMQIAAETAGTGTDNIDIVLSPAGTGNVGIGTTAPASKLHVVQATLGNAITTLASTTTNDDPTETTYQNKVTTTDATITTLATVPIPASTTVMIEARVAARRTGGTSGTAEDGAAYIVAGAYKNVAGTATEIGEGSLFSAEDQAGWACTIDVSGSNALLQVTGAADNNVSWVATYRVYSIST